MAQQRMPISSTMKRNIDAVLNKDYSTGSAYRDSGITITERPNTTILDVECTFHGHNPYTKQDFTFEPSQVNFLYIEQKFNDAYTDNISLNITLTPVQLLNMLDNYRSLCCTLRFFPRDSKTEYVDKTKCYFECDYIAVFKDKDIRKRVSKQALIPDTEMKKTNEHQEQMFDNIELQLIDKLAYNVRKKQFNFMMRDSTVQDVIQYLAKCIGVTNLCMVTPDNDTVYQNLIIPPMHTFATAMEFLQEYYGVYNKGLVYYFTNETLYVYPPYETKPHTLDAAHFYYAGEDVCAGSDIYHAYSEGKMLHIVISSTPNIKDLIDGGVESVGNAMLFQHADRIIDVGFTIADGRGDAAASGMGDINIDELNTSIYTTKADDYGISETSDTLTFKFDRNNPYRHRSDMNMFMRTLIGFSWQNAVPCSLPPGYQIHYHYDGEDVTRRPKGSDDTSTSYSDSAEYMSKDGICDQITWFIQPVKGGKTGVKQMYSCRGDIVLSIEYDPAVKEAAAKVSSYKVTKGESAYAGFMQANGVNQLASTEAIAAVRDKLIGAVETLGGTVQPVTALAASAMTQLVQTGSGDLVKAGAATLNDIARQANVQIPSFFKLK